METFVSAAQDLKNSLRAFFRVLGEDPDRDGLKGTPDRVVRALTEFTSGYRADIPSFFKAVFKTDYSQMIVVRNIEFYSTCEHHLLPFSGVAHVGYIPHERVIGLSKLARLVDAFAKRLQIQEQMTVEIANAIETFLETKGVGVVLEASHLCMRCRGAKKDHAIAVTSVLRGQFLDEPQTRAEFMTLCINHDRTH